MNIKILAQQEDSIGVNSRFSKSLRKEDYDEEEDFDGVNEESETDQDVQRLGIYYCESQKGFISVNLRFSEIGNENDDEQDYDEGEFNEEDLADEEMSEDFETEQDEQRLAIHPGYIFPFILLFNLYSVQRHPGERGRS